MERLRRLIEGPTFDICAPANARGRCGVQEFLVAYAAEQPRGYTRLNQLLLDVAEFGLEDMDTTLVRHVGEGVYEFKERGGLARLWGYIDPVRRRLIVLVLARTKNPGSGDRSKAQSHHIALAKKRCREYKDNPLPIE